MVHLHGRAHCASIQAHVEGRQLKQSQEPRHISLACHGSTPSWQFLLYQLECAALQVHVQGKQLDIAGVFYALALLHLPKLSMAQNFVHGVEATAELRVSMKRINDFLSLPEPPAPAHLQQGSPHRAEATPAPAAAAPEVTLGSRTVTKLQPVVQQDLSLPQQLLR